MIETIVEARKDAVRLFGPYGHAWTIPHVVVRDPDEQSILQFRVGVKVPNGAGGFCKRHRVLGCSYNGWNAAFEDAENRSDGLAAIRLEKERLQAEANFQL